MTKTALVAAQLYLETLVRASPVREVEHDSAGADLVRQAQLGKLLLLGQSEGPRASYRRLNPLYQQPTEVEMIVKRV